ncbi:HAD family phosphatase [Bifidobacterium callitrichos]|uniref:HAD family phosphatase n=1 Tax=Bifidobacterium callitrichos TaxID=762209 RepID=A0A5M9Z9T6_9BIFI|nr:HAD family phosphatase [Bifidobacterium callitrichos]KAA8815226.1 HAD family phosphatase [Bifidobacterium callitrichos]
MYTDIIFDFCDVLVDWRPRRAVEGLFPDDVLDALFDRHDPFGFWHYDILSDLGWSEEQVLAEYASRHGIGEESGGKVRQLEAYAAYFRRQRLALAGMLPGMAALLRDLDAAGVRCWGLTNFTVKYVDAARELFPALNILRDVVVSSAEKIHKPDAEIYRRAVARFGVDPEHTAFVDDKQRNADAASAAVPGLTGIRFVDEATLRPLLLGQ